MAVSRKTLLTQLTFSLCDLLPADSNDPHEIWIEFQDGGLRRPVTRDIEGRKILERVLKDGASIPADFTGDVIINRTGQEITNCRGKEKNAGGPDDPPRCFTV